MSTIRELSALEIIEVAGGAGTVDIRFSQNGDATTNGNIFADTYPSGAAFGSIETNTTVFSGTANLYSFVGAHS